MQGDYRELRPPPELARHVACLWYQRAGSEPLVQRVVPDACADIISVASGAPFVVGPATRTELVELAAGALIVGVRFRPGMAPPVLGVAANELRDRAVPLADLWGARADQLWNAIGDGAVEHRLRGFVGVLGRRLGEPDSLVAAAVAWLARHPDARVAGVADALGVSSRQLQRRFVAAAGYSPKLLHRVLRLQRLMFLARELRTSLADLALAAGYSDQPHMSREVLELAGVTPRALVHQQLPFAAMSEFFKTVGRGVP